MEIVCVLFLDIFPLLRNTLGPTFHKLAGILYKKTFLECPLTTFSPPHYLVGICKFLAPQMFFHRSKKVKV